jgi:N6-adenosine-specific RNA methylase IME4
MARFPVIIADPPVPFETWGKRSGGIDSRAADAHYNTMSWPALFNLGAAIRSVADDDCVLFLWLCQPLLRETLAMARRWGLFCLVARF